MNEDELKEATKTAAGTLGSKLFAGCPIGTRSIQVVYGNPGVGFSLSMHPMPGGGVINRTDTFYKLAEKLGGKWNKSSLKVETNVYEVTTGHEAAEVINSWDEIVQRWNII